MNTLKYKILIIDDDPVQIDSLSMMLEHIYDLESLSSGKNALEKVRKIRPDLILLDITMPDIDGFEVCRNFKEDEDLSDIPIIFCSARLKLEDKVKGFQSGGVDYITKPFEMEEVIARLNTHLKLKDALETISKYNSTLQERIEKQTKELIKAERHSAFSLMVKGIIHNLKNPLSVVVMHIDTIISKLQALKGLLRETDSGDEIYNDIDSILEYLKYSSEGCWNMDASLNMLMTKSYAEKEKHIKEVNLNGLISNELEFLNSNLILRNKVKKNIELYDGDLTIRVVPSEIIQIFQNLVKNAMDALSEVDKPELIVISGHDDDFNWFSVRDNGAGIPESKLPNIFDPFFTTKEEKEDKSSGLGLGLYFCNEIIKSYHGKIEVESKEGEGTEFKVLIPSV